MIFRKKHKKSHLERWLSFYIIYTHLLKGQVFKMKMTSIIEEIMCFFLKFIKQLTSEQALKAFI